MSNDFDRWIETIDVAALVSAAAPQNAAVRGSRGPNDPSYRGFDLVEHRPERCLRDREREGRNETIERS